MNSSELPQIPPVDPYSAPQTNLAGNDDRLLSGPGRRRGMLVVVSGPSGVGKDTVLELVLARDPLLKKCTTVTTRSPRPGEVEGKDYYFRTPEQFEAMIQEDGFLEWAHVHTHRYGTPLAEVQRLNESGFDVVLKIDVQGCAAVLQKIPDPVTIFLAPPSLEDLEQRRASRGTESPEEAAARRRDALFELERLPDYGYVVVNQDVATAAADILSILRAERLRTTRRLNETPART